MLKLRVLLRLVAFISTTACTEKQASTPAPTKAEIPIAKEVGPPIAIPLKDLPEAVVTLVEPLIKQAMNEPRNGEYRGALGMAYEANGFPDAAFNSYQQAENLASTNARWPYYQALILAGRGDHQLAVDAVSRAMSLNESYAALWMWRGVWLLDIARSIEALADFSKAESMGLKAAGLAGQARALLHQYKSEEALAILKPLARNAPFPSIYYLLGRAYRETGNMEQAKIALSRGDSTSPLSWQDPWVNEKRDYEVGFQADSLRAQRYLKAREYDKAITLFRELQAQQPDNPVIINRLSRAYADAGERQNSFWVLRRALAKEPIHYSVHLNIAPFYEARGDIESALDHLDQAISANPTVAISYTRKGLLLQKLRKYPEALAQLKQALDLTPNDPKAFFYIGDVEILMKNWSEGIRRFEQSIQVDPAFALGYLNLGLALASINNFEEARSALIQAKALGTHNEDVDAAMLHVAQLEARSK